MCTTCPDLFANLEWMYALYKELATLGNAQENYPLIARCYRWSAQILYSFNNSLNPQPLTAAWYKWFTVLGFGKLDLWIRAHVWCKSLLLTPLGHWHPLNFSSVVWFPFKFFILNIIIELTQFNKKWVYLNTLRTQSMIQSIKIRLTTCITKRKSKLTSQKSMFIGSTTNLHDSFIQTFFLNHLKILKHAHWLSISSKWM